VNESNANPSELRENHFIQLSVDKEKKIIENENQVNLRKNFNKQLTFCGYIYEIIHRVLFIMYTYMYKRNFRQYCPENVCEIQFM